MRLRLLASLGTMLLMAGCAEAAPASSSAGPEIELTFAGDVHFEGRVDKLLDDPQTAVGPASGELAKGDLTFVNLETPVTQRGTAEKKTYVFRARPQAVPALTAAGVDAVTLANNHSMDYGRLGLEDTMDAASKGGLGYVGAGRNVAEAFTPWRATVRGIRVAVLAFDQVDDLASEWAAGPDRTGLAMAFDTGRALAAVREARATSDVVVVLPHWGVEGDRCPTNVQKTFTSQLVQAGADVIVGAHTHVLQGAGRTGKGYVAYGMGDFLWYSSGLYQPYSSRAGILHLRLRGRTVVNQNFVPTVVSSTGQSTVESGWKQDLARQNYDALRGCAGVTPVSAPR
jgi:hypothetical protein